MQLISWMVARLGSRFSLLFEPHHRRVMHSALGRFLDEPMDLMIGLVEPDGTERVLPFTTCGTELFCCEQFERINSITYRGYSEHYLLRFEFNVHSVFYPQDEATCTIPAFYLEMRVSGLGPVRWVKPKGPTPTMVTLFLHLRRPDTQILASAENDTGRIDLTYQNHLTPQAERGGPQWPSLGADRQVQVRERIVSLNPGCQVNNGRGLSLQLPVTEVGSGIKWRLVWAAHCGEPILTSERDHRRWEGRFRYVNRLRDIEAVVEDAISHRDDRLVHSRRFERLFDQAPLRMAQRHLVHLGFQSFLNNSFWCDLVDPSDQSPAGQWFSVWEGRCLHHSTIDVEYNVALFYLALWPRLLALQLAQWSEYVVDHPDSNGGYLVHDLGHGTSIFGQAYHHPMPVEENADFLLMLQAYAHWTGDLDPVRRQEAVIEKLLNYLIWSDRDECGFATHGTANTIDDAGPALQYARKQIYLGIKRLAAIRAAGDLLGLLERVDVSERCEKIVERDAQLIESEGWLGDHYAVCADRTTTGLVDVWTGQPLPYEQMPGWDAYSIYTANGLLLPAMVGQPWILDEQRLRLDLTNATRETLGHYGCSSSSHEIENIRISQNLWRDHLACYLGLARPHLTQRYWDLQVMSNTRGQSSGFIDTYITNNLHSYPRGIAAIGFLMAQVRLVMDRLAPGGQRISIEPDRHVPQRWPLLSLADWKAGKVPVCVVDDQGNVSIENESDPVIIRGAGSTTNEMIG